MFSSRGADSARQLVAQRVDHRDWDAAECPARCAVVASAGVSASPVIDVPFTEIGVLPDTSGRFGTVDQVFTSSIARESLPQALREWLGGQWN